MNNYHRFKAFYSTASLWNGSLCGLKAFKLSQFQFHLDLQQQQELELPVIPHGTLLGKRAEYFFKFCIEQSLNYELIAHNIQIFKGKVTLGEIDYLIKDLKRNKVYHVELVYKFYIYDPDHTEPKNLIAEPLQTELARYLGPNRRDNLLYKLNRLQSHQLPLLYTTQAQEYVTSLGITVSEVEQQVCFLAHVFIPRHYWQHDFKYINKKCIAGYYLDSSAFAKAYTTNTYYLPEKFAWKMQPHAIEPAYTHTEVCEHSRKSLERGFAPLVWMLLENGSFERFFVIKDS